MGSAVSYTHLDVYKRQDQVTYLNGVEVKRENLSTTVLEEPVDQVVVTGTKKRPKTAEAGVSTGSMMWPVPSLHTITTGFESVSYTHLISTSSRE